MERRGKRINGCNRITSNSPVKTVRSQSGGVTVEVKDSIKHVDGRPFASVTTPKEVKKIAVRLEKEHTYLFEKDSLISHLKNNDKFREAILSGKYFYFLGRLCLYRPEALIVDGDTIKYSDIVLQNPEKYFLSKYRFVPKVETISTKKDIKGLAIRVSTRKSPVGIGAHNDSHSSIIYIVHAEKYLNDICRENVFLSQTVALLKKQQVKDYINNGQSGGTNYTFCMYFSYCMDIRNISEYELEELTGISRRTIDDMRNKERRKPSLVYIIACCIAMKLFPWESDYLLYLAGYLLRDNNKAERAYRVLLDAYYDTGSISECDKFLKELGLPALSDVIQKNQDNATASKIARKKNANVKNANLNDAKEKKIQDLQAQEESAKAEK